jgi:hypothetical protein
MGTNLVVVKIYNNSLGRMFGVSSYEEGQTLIQKLAEEQLDRSLTLDEIDEIENNQELYIKQDDDNHYCWALGGIEDYGNSL